MSVITRAIYFPFLNVNAQWHADGYFLASGWTKRESLCLRNRKHRTKAPARSPFRSRPYDRGNAVGLHCVARIIPLSAPARWRPSEDVFFWLIPKPFYLTPIFLSLEHPGGRHLRPRLLIRVCTSRWIFLRSVFCQCSMIPLIGLMWSDHFTNRNKMLGVKWQVTSQ